MKRKLAFILAGILTINSTGIVYADPDLTGTAGVAEETEIDITGISDVTELIDTTDNAELSSETNIDLIADDDFGSEIELIDQGTDTDNVILAAGYEANRVCDFVYDGEPINEEKIRNSYKVYKSDVGIITKYDVKYDVEGSMDAGSVYTIKLSEPGAAYPFYTEKVTVQKANLANLSLSTDFEAEYSGISVRPTATELGNVSTGLGIYATPLTSGDYAIKGYRENKDAGIGYVIIKATNSKNYTGTGEIPFTIRKYTGDVTYNVPVPVRVPYNGGEQNPEVDLRAYVGHEQNVNTMIAKEHYDMVCVTPDSRNVGDYNMYIEIHPNTPNLEGNEIVPGRKQGVLAYSIIPGDISRATYNQLHPISVDVTDDELINHFSEYFVVLMDGNPIDESEFTVTRVKGVKEEGREGTVVIEAKGRNFVSSSKDVDFIYEGVALDEQYVSASDFTYNGKAIRPNAEQLGILTGYSTIYPEDYEVVGYEGDCVNSGTAIAKIRGLGKYSNKESRVEYTISPRRLEDYTLAVSGIKNGSYSAGQILNGVSVAVLDNGYTIDTLTDCIVKADTIQNGIMTRVSVTGKGNYTGTGYADVNVKASVVDLSQTTPDMTIPAGLISYDAEDLKELLVVRNGNDIISPELYSLEYKSGNPKGEAGETMTFIIRAIKAVTGSKEFTVTVIPTDLKDIVTEVILNKDTFEYDGKQKMAAPKTIKVIDGYRPITSRDYTLSWKDNTDVGTAVLTITGQGDFYGSIDQEYTIGKCHLKKEDVSITIPDKKYRQFKEGPTENLADQFIVKVNTVSDFSQDDYTLTLLNPTEIFKVWADPDKTQPVLPTVTYRFDIKDSSRNFEGDSFEVGYPLVKRSADDAEIDMKTVYAAGDSLVPKETVRMESVLKRGIDYDIVIERRRSPEFRTWETYTGNVNSVKDQYRATITFKGFYEGVRYVPFKVEEKPFQVAEVKIKEKSAKELIYTGNAVEVETYYIGWNNDVDANKDRYYSVIYRDKNGKQIAKDQVRNVGKYTATVKGNDGKIGESYTFEITKRTLTDAEFGVELDKLEFDPVKYEGADSKTPVIKKKKALRVGLFANEFYVKSYDKEWADGTGEAQVGIKSANYIYNGTRGKRFKWTKGDLPVKDIYQIDPVVYNGEAHEPPFKPGKGMDTNVSWITEVAYKNNINAGTASVDITVNVPSGSLYTPGVYKRTIPFKILPKSLKNAVIENVEQKVYTGKQIMPYPKVRVDGVLLKGGKDYDMTYYNNIYPGRAKIVFTGKGNYKNATKIYFKILKTQEILEAEAELDEAVKRLKAAGKPDTNKEFSDALNALDSIIRDAYKVGASKKKLTEARELYHASKKEYDVKVEQKKEKTKKAADKATERARKAANKAKKNPTIDRLEKAWKAIIEAEKAIDEASRWGADVKSDKAVLKKARSAKFAADRKFFKNMKDGFKLNLFTDAMEKIPFIAKEENRKDIILAEDLYKKLTKTQKKTSYVKSLKDTLDEARYTIEHPIITFGNERITRSIISPYHTKRIHVREGNVFKLYAKSSTGSFIRYKSSDTLVATVSGEGYVKLKNSGKCTITVTSEKTKFKVLIKVSVNRDN